MKIPNTPADYADFVPVIRFAVASDLHIYEEDYDNVDRFRKMFETAYRFAEDSPYKNLDAVVLVGDIVGGGTVKQYEIFNRVVKECLRPGTELITMTGNHEFDEKRGEGVEMEGLTTYRQYCHPDPDRDVEINGFHLITLSLAMRNLYTEETQRFLAERVANAAKEDPTKPIFVFQHRHLTDTCYASMWHSSQSAEIRAILHPYPQVIDFSGHSHAPINHPRTIWQGDITCIGTGTLFEMEMEEGMTCGTMPEGSDDIAQYSIVEADARGRTRVIPYNILTDDIFETPSNTDPAGTKMTWYIDEPGKPFRYLGRENKRPPFFGEDARVTVDAITEDGAAVSFPQAYDDECVYGYEVNYTANGETKTVSFFSGFYTEPMPAALRWELTELAPDTEYAVEVVPICAFGLRGEPIRTAFTTAK